MRRSLSLTQQNALWLVAAFVAFELVAAVAVMAFLMLPMARRAAGDFGELLALSAETWSELPPGTRPAFERHLVEAQGIELHVARRSTASSAWKLARTIIWPSPSVRASCSHGCARCCAGRKRQRLRTPRRSSSSAHIGWMSGRGAC
jgi:hypothetical protein